ncbi:hypothetical protein D9758_003016 [Tetrapyrgos nigripes]|uniref:Thiaminase-2/PQQC domain-containing protein n=1 Tax=Tetrapyrgos nigripes TaxID=182062 RepID=A0A8H5GPQ6_9AGAR|nr:hypothetical protein D9758_003016 [Tetrapyrgos nigripes]
MSKSESESYSTTGQLLLSISSTNTSKETYKLATQNPFLLKAQHSNDLLSFWLHQDRIYAAHAYPKFIGSLIAKIPFSNTDSSTSTSTSNPEVGAEVRAETKAETLNQRILRTLVFCLTNIINEVQFFDETAKKWNLSIDVWKERKGTRDYTAEMARIASEGSIEDGLVFLWAMEKVYLDAWTYARENLEDVTNVSNPSNQSSKPESDSAFSAFAHNWSTPEFGVFVDDLAKLVDSVASAKDVAPDHDSRVYRRAKGIWDRVVELEIGFWPETEELP